MCKLVPQLMIELLYHRIRTDANYVPRNYNTIGGMWTVDTWKSDRLGYTARLEDEGCTSRVMTEILNVSTTYGRDAVFTKGSEVELLELYERVVGQQD